MKDYLLHFDSITRKEWFHWNI